MRQMRQRDLIGAAFVGLLFVTFIVAGIVALVRDLRPQEEPQPQRNCWTLSSRSDQEAYGPVYIPETEIKTELPESGTNEGFQLVAAVTVEPVFRPMPLEQLEQPKDPEPVNDMLGWMAEHDSEQEVCTLFKKVSANHLFVKVVIGSKEFVFHTGEFAGEDTEWKEVEETYTSQEVVDLVYVTYHEVSNSRTCEENRQAQCQVILNRRASKWFPDSIRGVITARLQYECKGSVLARELKSNNDLEREDLICCVSSVLRVLVVETIEEIPENVVYAATFEQGHGLWRSYNGTYYCFL